MSSSIPEDESMQELNDSGCVQDGSMADMPAMAQEEMQDPPEEVTPPSEPASLLDLSDDVLLMICSFCTPRDLKALGHTCSRLGAIVCDRTLWTRVDARSAPTGQERLRWFLTHGLSSTTNELHLHGYVNRDARCLGIQDLTGPLGPDTGTGPGVDVEHFLLRMWYPHLPRSAMSPRWPDKREAAGRTYSKGPDRTTDRSALSPLSKLLTELQNSGAIGRITGANPNNAGENSNNAQENSNNAQENSNNAQESSRNAGANSNNASANSRNVERNSSNAGPNSSNAGPNSSNAGPNSSDAGPNSSNAGPNSRNAGPNSSNAGPNSSNAGPNSSNAESKNSDSSTSKSSSSDESNNNVSASKTTDPSSGKSVGNPSSVASTSKSGSESGANSINRASVSNASNEIPGNSTGNPSASEQSSTNLPGSTKSGPNSSACGKISGNSSPSFDKKTSPKDEMDEIVSSCHGPQFTLNLYLLKSLKSKCPNLTSLSLEYCNLDYKNTNLRYFPPKLKKLSLKGTRCYNLPLSNSYLGKIQEYLPELEYLDISECEWFEPASLMPLSKVPKLRELYMKNCRRLTECVAYASLATRYGFQELRILDVRGSPVADSEVSAFGWLPNLEELYVAPPDDFRNTSEHSHKWEDVLAPLNELDEWEIDEPDYFKCKSPPLEFMDEDDDVKEDAVGATPAEERFGDVMFRNYVNYSALERRIIVIHPNRPNRYEPNRAEGENPQPEAARPAPTPPPPAEERPDSEPQPGPSKRPHSDDVLDLAKKPRLDKETSTAEDNEPEIPAAVEQPSGSRNQPNQQEEEEAGPSQNRPEPARENPNAWRNMGHGNINATRCVLRSIARLVEGHSARVRPNDGQSARVRANAGRSELLRLPGGDSAHVRIENQDASIRLQNHDGVYEISGRVMPIRNDGSGRLDRERGANFDLRPPPGRPNDGPIIVDDPDLPSPPIAHAVPIPDPPAARVIDRPNLDGSHANPVIWDRPEIQRQIIPAILRGARPPSMNIDIDIHRQNFPPNIPHIGYHLVSDSSVVRFGRADNDNINYVHIGHNYHPNDPGVRPDRSNLRVLSITGFRNITDRSLVHLATAAPHIRHIDFSYTTVTPHGVEIFKAMRPNCEVIFSEYGKM